jgi:transketolase
MNEVLDGTKTKAFATFLRAHAIRMITAAKASHLGSCLSIADLLANLYGGFLRVNPDLPGWVDRDRLFLSKGHAAAILYAALAKKGFFPVEELQQYCKEGARLTGHVTTGVPGVEFSTGSLGHALPVGCGVALAAKREDKRSRTIVILSDGELDEGSNWEAILFAAHHELDNLIAIVDFNKIQSFGAVEQVLRLEPLADKWRSFGWSVQEINGHDHGQIANALSSLPFSPGMPNVIIAHTVKGKGVSFMEGELAWHYKSPTMEQAEAALRELEDAA